MWSHVERLVMLAVHWQRVAGEAEVGVTQVWGWHWSVVIMIPSVHLILREWIRSSEILKIFVPHFELIEGETERERAEDETIQSCYHCENVDPAHLAASQRVETNLDNSRQIFSRMLWQHLWTTDCLYFYSWPSGWKHQTSDQQKYS